MQEKTIYLEFYKKRKYEYLLFLIRKALKVYVVFFLQGIQQCTAVTSFCVNPYILIHVAAVLDLCVGD